jgi:hypothetical protein
VRNRRDRRDEERGAEREDEHAAQRERHHLDPAALRRTPPLAGPGCDLVWLADAVEQA